MLQETTIEPHTDISRLALTLNLSASTLRELCDAGELRASKTAGKYIVQDKSVHEYLARTRVTLPQKE